MKLFLSPHNDDETLFGAFTIMRERPLVCVVFDSYVQAARGLPISATQRRRETIEAMTALGVDLKMFFPGFRDDDARPELYEMVRYGLWHSYRDDVEHVFAPAIEDGGHEQHNLVGRIADELWPGKVTHYLTYTRHGGKSINGAYRVDATGDMIVRKLRALACYRSQIEVLGAGCWQHFMRELYEYYAER